MWNLHETVDLKITDGIDQSDLLPSIIKDISHCQIKNSKPQKQDSVPNQKNRKDDEKKVKGLPCKNQSCQHPLGKVEFTASPKSSPPTNRQPKKHKLTSCWSQADH
jgi:hypothetical protein